MIELGGTFVMIGILSKVFGEKNLSGSKFWKPTKIDAGFQCDCIKQFLVLVGKAHAKELGLEGKSAEQFAMTESNALNVVNKEGRSVLYIDLTKAPECYKWRMSWPFERLRLLSLPAEQKKTVKLRTGYLLKSFEIKAGEIIPPSGATGSDKKGTSLGSFVWINDFSNKEHPQTEKLKDYWKGIGNEKSLTNDKEVKTEQMKKYWENKGLKNIPLRDPLDIGRTIVHELAIHAWRHYNWPHIQQWYNQAKCYQEFRYSQHRYQKHSGKKFYEHNWADIEADVLDYYQPPKVHQSSQKKDNPFITECPEMDNSIIRAGGPDPKKMREGIIKKGLYWKKLLWSDHREKEKFDCDA